MGMPVFNAMTVLAISGEAVVQKILAVNLQQLGLLVTSEESISKACDALQSVRPDLIIVDSASVPMRRNVHANHIIACAQANGIPVITLLGKSDASGAESEHWPGRTVSKPFAPRQLINVVRSVLQQDAGYAPETSLSAGGIVLNPLTHRVRHGQVEIPLRPKEFRLLAFLMKHVDRVFDRCQLLDGISGNEAFLDERSVDVLVRRLRMALQPYGLADRIGTVRGAGYRFCV
jgi:two-component system phosphate regulon response regulator PhoB